VIAEQVEDDAAADAARSIGCDFLQGYALGRPAPLPMAA
jgi:EAL domain-containing protein (putative c-di-GMP-specific phosphodiesterase class I)